MQIFLSHAYEINVFDPVYPLRAGIYGRSLREACGRADFIVYYIERTNTA